MNLHRLSISCIPFLASWIVVNGELRGNAMKQKSLINEDLAFWSRELKMSVELEPVVNECPLQKTVDDPELVRAELRKFVESLEDGLQKKRGYHPNIDNQVTEWHTCTIVSQCLDPTFILSMGRMSSASRGHVYRSMSKAMSQESFNMLQLQQLSNMLLGEMQDWGTVCPGECRELYDPDGLLEPVVRSSLADQSDLVPFTNYAQCGNLRATSKTFWYCKDEPRMVHQANINVTNGKYILGDIWNEPHIHGRNSFYDFFAAYGDLKENGGAFGLRFSGHHIDLNYQWNDKGELVNDDMPVFLGHNPLIVPEVTPPLLREHNDKANDNYHPLMWTNMAGTAQFAESVNLVVKISNFLLKSAPGSFVSLDNWRSTGSSGSLSLNEGLSISDFDVFDLSIATDNDFQIMWNIVDYTLKFAHGHKSTKKQRDLFRREGKAIWTSTSPPETNLPLTDEDLRSNMNFINLRIETDDYLFFVMINQMYVVVSENEPTNHLHSIYVKKSLMNPNHACINKGDETCQSNFTKVDPHVDHLASELISGPFKYETSKWDQRSLKGKSEISTDGFDRELRKLSQDFCDLGISATIFDGNAEKIYEETVGSNHSPLNDGGYSLNDGLGQFTEGFTADTTLLVYSNAKVLAATTFLAAVVDTGLGYLDEPIQQTFTDYIKASDVVGTITPRMILSHNSGIDRTKFNRNDLTNPYYACLINNSTTHSECLGTYVLTDDVIQFPPGSMNLYSNEPFDIIAELTVRKTGLKSFGEAFRKYVTEPLGMDDTTYDCPIQRSTSEKPRVAWGICSTSTDMAKLVQMLANGGKKIDGQQILSPFSLKQIFTNGGINTKNDFNFGFFPLSRCFDKFYMPGKLTDGNELGEIFGPGVPYGFNFLTGYGLGTMFMLGNYGELFIHLASVGGMWVVAPGRYSLYLGWSMAKSEGILNGYLYDLLNALEEGSNFTVSKTNTLEERYENVEMCGGHDMFIDSWSRYGISSMRDLNPPPKCAAGGRRTTEIHPYTDLFQEAWSQSNDQF